MDLLASAWVNPCLDWCPKCYSNYNTFFKVKTILPCGHICCWRCAFIIRWIVFGCPACRKGWPVSQFCNTQYHHNSSTAQQHQSSSSIRHQPYPPKPPTRKVKVKRCSTPRDHAKLAGNKTIDLKENEQEMRLETVKKLGEGSFGQVYLARTGSGELVALKKINLNKLMVKQNEYARRELKALKEFAHPYIVAYKGFEDQGHLLHILMEYCSGGDLAKLIEERNATGTTFKERQVFNWVLRLCLALKYLHGRRHLHRDIKPSNILLTGTGQIKLGDFGLVREFSEDSDKASTYAGTLAYMSPEILQREPYDSKADMWSLGCCCYELAVLRIGCGPYTEVTIPSKFRSEYKDLVVSLLKKVPDQRPSASEILQLPFMVELTGSELEAREEEAAWLMKEVRELTEATQEQDRLSE